MKRLRPIKLLVTLAAALIPVALPAVNTIIHTATYGSSGLTLGTDTLGGVTYTTVSYGDLYSDGNAGMPSLPIDYLKFSVPYNATNFSVTATLSNNMTQYIDHLVFPSQPPRMMSDTTPVVITMPDSAVYYSNTFYPSQPAWVVDEGFLAGENHIVTVAVMPIAYKHKTAALSNNDQLRRSGTVRLTLRYDLSDSLAIYPIVRNDTALRNEGYRLAQSMVVNPSNVESYAPSDLAMDTMIVINPNPGDGLNLDPPQPIDDLIDPNPGVLEQATCPYLIVTTPELKHSLRRIAALKRQKGYGVAIVTMDDVMNNPYASGGDRIKQSDGTYHTAFGDSAGVLRQFLKLCYANLGTQYVFLAGKDIPFRLKPFYKTSAPSDLYFSDLNADWTADTVEKNPELFVGRIMPRNNEQVANYTNKLFRYELNPGNGDRSYLRGALFTEGHDFHKNEEARGVEQFFKKLFNYNTSDSIMYEDISKNDKFPSGKDIVNEINNTRYGYLSFHNHGASSGLITYGYRSDTTCENDTVFHFLWAIDSVRVMPVMNGIENYINADTLGRGLNNLTNKYHPSICYSVACTTIPYDTIACYSSIPMNFGESFTLGKDYGGPAFLGNTREGVLFKSSQLEELFMQQLSQKDVFKIGKAEAFSKLKNSDYLYHTLDDTTIIDNYYFSCVHNILGDPEFEIWTDIPQQFTNISITRTDNSITVSGIPDNSTTIAIYSNDGSIRSVLANPPGITRYISPNSTVMLYKHNYIPYIAPLLLQNVNIANSQYVIASDVIAGNTIDSSNRTPGDVIVKNGIEYEIEASGTVTLQDGFKVEKGATFAVYPSCF